MKKVILLIVAVFAINFAFSQANKQLNFGLIGISYDIPIATDIAIAPTVRTDFNINYLIVGVKGDYYFDNLIGLPAAFDFYAGANAGYAIGIGSGIDHTFGIGLEVGGRWFWNEKWGLYLELGGTNIGGTGGLGLTMKL